MVFLVQCDSSVHSALSSGFELLDFISDLLGSPDTRVGFIKYAEHLSQPWNADPELICSIYCRGLLV